MMLHELQIWAVTLLSQPSPVKDFMNTAWAWPTMESLHFLGLCLLIGWIGTFDLRLLGVARRVPIAPPRGPFGFSARDNTRPDRVLMTEPGPYLYNPSFNLKTLLTIARQRGLSTSLCAAVFPAAESMDLPGGPRSSRRFAFGVAGREHLRR